MNAAKIAAALGSRKTARGWCASCPAHNDRHPSLDIAERPDGRVLFICRAGCSQAEVIDALRERGLWSPSSSRSPAQSCRTPEVLPPYAGPSDTGSCCLGSLDCDHWLRFNRRWLLAELRKNLVEACRELIDKIKRADQPVAPEILRKAITFAVPFGAIVPPGVDDATVSKAIDLAIAEFTRGKQAA
jgi:hypothetical protein